MTTGISLLIWVSGPIIGGLLESSLHWCRVRLGAGWLSILKIMEVEKQDIEQRKTLNQSLLVGCLKGWALAWTSQLK